MRRQSAEAILRRAGVVAAMAGAIAIALPTVTAQAVNRVDCGDRQDFAKVINNGYSGSLCFANSGWTSVRIYNVDQINAGNNRVSTWTGTQLGTWVVYPWQSEYFNSDVGHEVTMYDITLS